MNKPFPSLASRGAPGERRVNIIQGEFQVTSDPNVVLTTLLGSCVAACIHDPVSGIGGLNHFLLPEADGTTGSELRYGAYSMELLINGVLKAGARRNNLRVWLFGGARLHEKLSDVGARNAEFAEDFVRREELTSMGGCLRGSTARRIQFWPVQGRVRQLRLARDEAPTPPPRVAPVVLNDVELF